MSGVDLATLRAEARKSEVGKNTGGALYVHRLAISHLPPGVLFYARSAIKRAEMEEGTPWNILKIHLHQELVSFLWYPAFAQDPHPALLHSTVFHLRSGRKKFRPEGQENPSILHRKELMIWREHPSYRDWKALTQHEEDLGYYEQPSRIGRLRGWERAIQQAKVKKASRPIHCPQCQSERGVAIPAKCPHMTKRR